MSLDKYNKIIIASSVLLEITHFRPVPDSLSLVTNSFHYLNTSEVKVKRFSDGMKYFNEIACGSALSLVKPEELKFIVDWKVPRVKSSLI